MKFLPLFSSLLAISYASPLAEVTDVHNVDSVEAADAEKPAGGSQANGVKILPRFSESEPRDGAKRTTVKYGTYSVTSTKMLSTFKLAKGPCPLAGCYVTAMEATIRYPDGKEANVDTKAWLHHIALFGSGGGQGSIWACGNERPTLRLNSESKYGLDFPSQFMMMIDLMTEDPNPKSLTLEITYEWVPKTASGYKAAAMYWLTIGEPAAKDGVYSFKTMPTSSGYSGKLLYAIGHMHDGGTDMRLYVNSKLVCKSVMHYNGRAGYGGDDAKAAKGAAKGTTKAKPKPKAVEEEAAAEEEAPAPKPAKASTAKGTTTKAKPKPKAADDDMAGMEGMKFRRDGHGGHGGHDGMEMEHISDPGACTDFGTVSKGDRMTSEAWYDAVTHPLMVHNGKKENLMGNMRVYLGPA